MTKKSLRKTKFSVWIGLAFVFTTVVVVAYYWYSHNYDSQVGSKHQTREVGKEAIKKSDDLLTRREQMRGFSAEKRVPFPGQRDESNGRERGDSAQNGSLFGVTSDDESKQFTEQDRKKRLAGSKAADPDRRSGPESATLDETEEDAYKPDYSDAEPPDVISIRFDPQQVAPGASVSVYVQAKDNLSGVSSISGAAKSPSGAAMLSFGCRRSGSDGPFVGTLAIPDRAELGAWYLKTLRATDKVHNRRTYSENSALLRNSYFVVVGSDSDNVPPEVTAVYFNPLEVYGGDKIQVTVEAQDDKSGVARIHGVLLSPSKHARLGFSCRYEGETNMLYGHLTIPEDAEAGLWTLEYLRAEDEARNAKTFVGTHYPGMFDNASVHVYTNNSDSQPPTLDSLMVYPTIVAYEETAKIVVNASDDIAGVNSVSGRLQSPSGKAHIPFACVYDPDSQEYEAEVTIPNNAEIGLWRVAYILMIDNARNRIDYTYHTNAFLQEAVLEIIGE
jgi:hypothetical protein